jgi:hypothetical protein
MEEGSINQDLCSEMAAKWQSLAEVWVTGWKKEDKRSGRQGRKEDPRPRRLASKNALLSPRAPSQAASARRTLEGNHRKVTRKNIRTSATPLHFTSLTRLFCHTVVSREISASQHHLPPLDIIFLTKHHPFNPTPFHYRQHVRQGRSSHSLQPAPIRYPTAGSITECASRISSRPGHRLATERQCGARSGRRGRRPVVNGFDVRCARP